MILYLTDEIDKSWTDRLIDFIDKIPDKEIGTVYIRSPGGSKYETDIIVSILNSNAGKIKLIGNNHLYSGGFEIFFSFKGERELMKNIIGMYHQGSTPIEVQYNNKPTFYSGANHVKHNKKVLLKETMRFAKSLGFTKRETKRLKRGDDVCFSEKRMNEMLNESKI